jgi:flagellar biosynthesis anti-sigma factor FlgM
MKGITGNPVLDAYHRMAVNPVGAARPVAPAAASANTTSPVGTAADVKISSRAYDLAASTEQATVDAQKVESIKKRISEGSFQVNNELIAQRMLDAG